MSAVRDQLQQLVDARLFLGGRPDGFTYLSTEEFTLHNGREFESLPLTEEEREVVSYAIERVLALGFRFAPKQCFNAAQLLAIADKSDRLVYCEGYASTGSIAFHHAWIAIDGKVVDLTLRSSPVDVGSMSADEFADHLDGEEEAPEEVIASRILGEIPERVAYFGTEFPEFDALGHVVEFEETHPILGDHRKGFPFLRPDGGS